VVSTRALSLFFEIDINLHTRVLMEDSAMDLSGEESDGEVKKQTQKFVPATKNA